MPWNEISGNCGPIVFLTFSSLFLLVLPLLSSSCVFEAPVGVKGLEGRSNE